MFVFGYLTCKVFYFLRSVRLSIVLIKLSQVISLAMLVRSIEHFSYARALRIRNMRASGESDHNIAAFQIRFDEELQKFKHASIKDLCDLHPSFYEDIVPFKDWDSAMFYLNNEGRLYMDKFIRSMR